jgi:hypothetical protein
MCKRFEIWTRRRSSSTRRLLGFVHFAAVGMESFTMNQGVDGTGV